MVFKLHSINQGLEVSKFRIAKNNFTTPRLELTSALMSVNSVANGKLPIENENVKPVAAWKKVPLSHIV